MPDSNYEIDILFTLNEASARRAAEEARRIFNEGGAWGPNFGAGQGQGGGGGGGGRAGAPLPRDPDDLPGARAKRLSQELGLAVTELRALSRAAGDVAKAMQIVTQRAYEARYGRSGSIDFAQRRAYERAERTAGAFEGAARARQEGPYGAPGAGGAYQSAYEQSRFTTARQENLSAARTALGALDAETQYSVALNRASNERRRAFEQLAKAQYDDTSPVRLSDATRRRINAFDPTILRNAEHKAQQVAQEQARQEQLGRLDTFLRSDAPLSQKFLAGFSGRPPGEPKLPGTGGGFWEGFTGGEGNFSKVIGQAARFGVVYGAIYALMGAVTSGFASAAKGAADYEEALISLNLATQASTEDNRALADQASRLGTALGYGAPEGVQAAARAIGLYDLNAPGTTEADRQQLALLSTNVAGRIARVSGTDLDQTQTQVAGLVRSFGLSPFEQSRVEDQLSVIARQSGRNPAELLSAGTQIGQIAHTAGFDLPDTLAIISQVSSQTGQTADAVAGQLSQVLSKANDPAALSRLASVGVDVQGTTLKQQIEQLSSMNLDPATRSQVVQAFGRSRSGASFDILLQNLGRVQGLAAEGRAAEPGSGERTFDTVMSSLSKQLLELKGTLQNIANGLAQAGIFQAVGHLVVVFGAMAKIVEHVIQVYNSLPGPIREGIGTIIELIVMFRLLRLAMQAQLVQQAATGLGGLLQNLLRGGGRIPGLNTLREARLASLGASAAARAGGAGAAVASLAGLRAGIGAAGAAAGAGGLAAAGSRLLPLVGGVPGLLVGAAIGIGTGLYGADQASRRTQSLAQQANAAAGSAGTAEELRTAAGRFDQAVQAAQKQQELSLSNFLDQGLAPWLLRLQGSDSSAAKAERTGQERSAELRKQADDLDKAQASATIQSGANAFQNFASADAVNSGLQVLKERGYSAAQQLAALNQAMDGFTASSTRAAGAVGFIQQGAGEVFTRAAASAPGKAIEKTRLKLQNTITGLTPKVDMDWWDRQWSGLAHLGDTQQSINDMAGVTDTEIADRAILDKALQGGNLQKEANSAIGDYLKSIGKDATRGPVSLNADEIARVKEIEQGLLNKYAPGLSKFTAVDLKRNLEAGFGDATGAFINTTPTLTDVTSFLSGAVPLADSTAQDVADIARDPSLKPERQLQELQAARQRAMNLIAQMPTGTADEVKSKADALNAVNTAIDAAIARTYDDQFKARSEVIDRQVASAQSMLAIEDTIGRRAAEISGLRQKLALPNLSEIERQETQTQLANAQAQQAQDEREGARSVALGKAQLGGAYLTGNFVGTNQKAILDLNLANATADYKRLKDLPDTNKAKGDALQAVAAAAQAELDYATAVKETTAKLALKPNDAVGQAQADIDAALDAYNLAKATGDQKAINEAELKLRDTRAAKIQAVAQQHSYERAALLTPNSVTGEAANALADAAEALDNAKRNDVGNVQDAQARYNKALYDYTSAQLDFAQQVARDFDYTDPVQAGEKTLRDIQQRLDARDKNGQLLERDPQRRQLLQLQADHQRLANEKTAFEQRQRDISDYEELGRITHADALQMRKNDRARLASELASMKATDEGYRQKQDELTELDKTIKAATDKFQGQFNIGGIKLPTVYEIRRSLGITDGAATSATNNYANYANVTINGADFAKVVDYLNKILGKPTRNVRANTTRVVG